MSKNNQSFQQIAGNKINLQNSVSLYQQEKTEKISMETAPFIIASEKGNT